MKINEILQEGPAYNAGYAAGSAVKKGSAMAGQAAGMAARGAATGAAAAAQGVFRGLKQAAPSSEFYNYAGGDGPKKRVYQVQLTDPTTGQLTLYTRGQQGWVGPDNITIMDPNMIKTLDQTLAAQKGQNPERQPAASQPKQQPAQQQPAAAQ